MGPFFCNSTSHPPGRHAQYEAVHLGRGQRHTSTLEGKRIPSRAAGRDGYSHWAANWPDRCGPDHAALRSPEPEFRNRAQHDRWTHEAYCTTAGTLRVRAYDDDGGLRRFGLVRMSGASDAPCKIDGGEPPCLSA